MPSRFPTPEIEGLLELEWFERLTEWRRVHGSDFWRLKRPVAVFLDDKFIGSDVELLKMTSLGNIFVESVPGRDASLMKSRFQKDYLAHLKDTKLIHCYFDICVDDAFIGTLVFQLYSDILPKTCENFTTLCLGTKGSYYSYKGSQIHRIVKDLWLQGGDIQYPTNGGGFSINRGPLENECYGISHDRRGVLSLAKDRKHTNGTQFIITLNPCTWMDTHCVAFGQLIEGVKVLNALENIETIHECPLKRIEIKNCGKLNLGDAGRVDVEEKMDVKLKKKRKIETIADQVVRLVMEAVTECLAMKEHAQDIIHSGDVPSRMSLDMFFHGLYSLPEEVLEDSAKYIRTHRREFLRHLRPSATEVVEVITYDLLTAVFTKLVDLDDVRQALTFPMYNKLLDGINMEVEMVEKPYVKKFVDQLTETAEKMLKVLTRNLMWIRRKSVKTRIFQDQMSEWVKSFTLQETFADDNFRISDRPEHVVSAMKQSVEEGVLEKQKKPPKEEDIDPCTKEKKKTKRRFGREPTAAELCCDGEPSSEEEPTLGDFFSKCYYELKTVKRDRRGRIPILDLIECGRYQLKVLRHHEHRYRTKARICLEKRISRWMKDVQYTPETDWVRQTVFTNDDICFSHTEEIMYGAMTVGLLEMYFLFESYLKKPRRKKYITRVLYPDGDMSTDSHLGQPRHMSSTTRASYPDGVLSTEVQEVKAQQSTLSLESDVKRPPSLKSRVLSEVRKSIGGENLPQTVVANRRGTRPCSCGDICCDCPFAPGEPEETQEGVIPPPPTPSPSVEAASEHIVSEEGELLSSPDVLPEVHAESVVFSDHVTPELSESSSCYIEPEEVDIDVDQVIAQVMGESKEKVNVKSFRWMQSYIEEHGCEFKSKFAKQVHNWLEKEVFSYSGFLSKHSLVTRASLLSFSLSIASLIKEENELKSELKDFVYDLWELYFREMMKEAMLENPPEQVGSQQTSEGGDGVRLDPCSGVRSLFKKEFDFDKFCQKESEQKEEPPRLEDREEKPSSGREQEAEPSVVEEQETEFPVVEEQKGEPSNMEEQETEPPRLEDQQAEPPRPDETYPPAQNSETTFEADNAVDDDVMVEMKKEENKEEVELEEEASAVEDEEGLEASQRKPTRKLTRPIIIRELIVSSEEIRPTSPYTLPLWIFFLAEITKRALGLIAKSGRLPRRLYFTTDSQISFDDKMKEWIEFNRFTAPVVGGRDLRDFIARHHVDTDNLDETARSFLRKQRIAQLMEKSSRTSAAETVAEELILDVQMRTLEKMITKSSSVPIEILEDLIAAATTQSATTSEIVEEDMIEPETELFGEWN